MKQFVFINTTSKGFKSTEIVDAIREAERNGESYVELVICNENTKGEWVEMWTQKINFEKKEYQKMSLQDNNNLTK